jgi:hypothetical protein
MATMAENVKTRRGEPVIVTLEDGRELAGYIEFGDETTSCISVATETSGARIVIRKGDREKLRTDPGGGRPLRDKSRDCVGRQVIDIAKLIEAHRHDLRELGEFSAYKLLVERLEALRNETLYEAAAVCDRRAEARAELPQGKDWMSVEHVTTGNEIRKMAKPTRWSGR